MDKGIETDFCKWHDASEFLTSCDSTDYLGCGGIGEVRRCWHKDYGQVAIKRLPLKGTNSGSDVINKIEREAKLNARLHHKNITQFHGLVKWGDYIGMIFSLEERGNLEDLLTNKMKYPQIPWCLRGKLALDIANGLVYLHEHDPKRAFVHGDIKSQNIFISLDWIARLGDLGATNVHKSAKCLTTGSFRVSATTQHTLRYSAPEFLTDLGQQRTPQMDCYGYGIVLYEILTRTLAFENVDRPDYVLSYHIRDGKTPDMGLVESAKQNIHDGKDFAMFSTLKKAMNMCLCNPPECRPSMQTVTEMLATALNLFGDTERYKDVSTAIDTRSSSSENASTLTRKSCLGDFGKNFTEAYKRGHDNLTFEQELSSDLTPESNLQPQTNILERPRSIAKGSPLNQNRTNKQNWKQRYSCTKLLFVFLLVYFIVTLVFLEVVQHSTRIFEVTFQTQDIRWIIKCKVPGFSPNGDCTLEKAPND